ncbi:hypothetical protein ACXR0O_26960 [Verrucomicrobiota bacterium sgz303538]
MRLIAPEVEFIANLLQLIANLHELIANLLESFPLKVELIELRVPSIPLRMQSIALEVELIANLQMSFSHPLRFAVTMTAIGQQSHYIAFSGMSQRMEAQAGSTHQIASM